MIYFSRKKDLKRCESCEYITKHEEYGMICGKRQLQIWFIAGECAHEAGLYPHISKICRNNIHDGCKKEVCDCDCHRSIQP